MNLFAVPVTYEQLVVAIRDRRRELGFSQTDVDLIAGMPGGYQGKLEASLTNPRAKNARSIGARSLPLVMTALGLKLGIISLATPKKNAKRGQVEIEKGSEIIVLPALPASKIFQERGRRGGLSRSQGLSPEARSEAARAAALARWAADPNRVAKLQRELTAAKRAAGRKSREQ